jgi:hypothetical protein
LLGACLVHAAGGCAAIGAVAYKVSGPAAVEPRYRPVREPMLVMVENYRTPSAAFVTADQIRHAIAEDLQTHDVAPLVDSAALDRLRQQRPDAYHSMRISEIGQAVGARQVLYVELVEAGVNRVAMSDYYRGSISVRVKLIDVSSGKTLWPTSDDTYPLTAHTQTARDAGGMSPERIRDEAVWSIAVQVSRLFHKWKPED